MDLNLKHKLFVVCGASSGFGRAISLALSKEGARIIIVARGEEKLLELEKINPRAFISIVGDITQTSCMMKVIAEIGTEQLYGAVINAGGPPAMSFSESTLIDWDNAYQNLLRWKVEFTKLLLPFFEKFSYGRLVYIESSAVKQPIENLILSTSLRLGVVGFVKTLSQEIASSGVTLNIMAPGYHDTPAVKRLFAKKAQQSRLSEQEVKSMVEKEIKVGKTGNPDDFAGLALWLLSEGSKYVTGQTYSVDGGTIKSTL